MFAVPSFFGYNTTFVSTPVATAATGVGETSFTANWNAFAGASYYLLDVSTSSSFSSFVGSYQNFVVISNSQVVSGLTANTTYYYRLRAATGVDADAASFFSRVYTAGGALSYTEVSATETLVANLKANSLWTPMKAIYPMVGASAAACAQNLKSSSFTGTFSSGWTFASTGVTPNGSSAYMNSGLNANSDLSVGNFHYSYYSRTNNSTPGYEIGIADGVTHLIFNYTGGGNGYISYNGYDTFAVTNSRGFQVASLKSSTFKGYKDNVTKVNKSVTANALPSLNFLVGCDNRPTGPIEFSSKQCAFSSIGDGLTDTQASNFYTAVQAFQTTLSRNV